MISVVIAVVIIIAALITAPCLLKHINRRRRRDLERNKPRHEYEPSPRHSTTDGDNTTEDNHNHVIDDITLVGNICYATPSMRKHGGASLHDDDYDDVIPPSQLRKSPCPGYENVDPRTGLPITPTPYLKSPTNENSDESSEPE